MITAISNLDTILEQALYAVRDPSLVKFFMWVTQLGEYTTVIPAITLIVGINLVYRKRWTLAAGLFLSVFGSYPALYIVKKLIARPRPDTYLNAYFENGFSFPSAHAALSVALYGFLLWLIWDSLSPVQKRIKAVAVSVLIIAIGFSRLYLGVHYLSDVLAGYLLGGIFVVVGIKITRKLRERPTSVLN